jgi:hypothetical protein
MRMNETMELVLKTESHLHILFDRSMVSSSTLTLSMLLMVKFVTITVARLDCDLRNLTE